MKKRIAFVAALIVALYGTAWAAAQFIYLGGPLGDQGTFPVLGQSNVIVDAAADHVALQSEYAGEALYVTSTGTLSAPAKVILPLVQGETKLIYNATTGGQALLVGGPTGTAASVATQSLALVHSPDGVNYTSLSGSGGGSGFDASTYSGTGFFAWDGSTLLWRALAIGDLPTITLTGDTTGAASGGSISTTTLRASGVVDNAYSDGGANFNIDAGETRICDTVTGKSCVRGAIIKSPSFTDNSTWVTIAYHSPANRSSSVYEWEYVVSDQTDTVDAGVVDMATCHLIYTTGVSNGGNINLTGFQGSAIGTTVALTPQSCTVTLADAGLSSSAFQFQATVSGAQVLLQGKGLASKTYDVNSFALTHIGGI